MSNNNESLQAKCMQLIGEWGCSPETFYEDMVEWRKDATDIGDMVGFAAASAMIALGKFSICGDSNVAIKEDEKDIPMKTDKGVVRVLDSIMEQFINSDETFSETVISETYEKIRDCKTFSDAEIAMRRRVAETVLPIFFTKLARQGSDVVENLVELFVGIEHTRAMLEGSGDADTRRQLDNIGEIVRSITKYSDAIRGCLETPSDSLNQAARTLLGDDIDELIIDANLDLLSILDKPPHEWTSYALKFGKLIMGFFLATSLGFVDYDEHRSAFARIKSINNHSMDHGKDKEPGVSPRFGRN